MVDCRIYAVEPPVCANDEASIQQAGNGEDEVSIYRS